MGYRKSHQRDRILQLLIGTNSHPTADWVYRKLKKEIPGLSLGTVYRNLNVLLEQGLIQKLPFDNTFDRFEGNVAPHYHLICEKCGAVEDFEMPVSININKQVEQRCSFKINRHRTDFFGICVKCQHQSTTNKEALYERRRKNNRYA
jgi:Fur family transcriptional regulator, peroxide stress response regulator